MTTNTDYEELEDQLRTTPLAKPFLVTAKECADAITALRRELEEARSSREDFAQGVRTAEKADAEITALWDGIRRLSARLAEALAEVEWLTGERDAASMRGDYSAGLSGSGVNIRGDRASIDRVKAALHNNGYLQAVVDELRPRAIAAERLADRYKAMAEGVSDV